MGIGKTQGDKVHKIVQYTTPLHISFHYTCIMCRVGLYTELFTLSSLPASCRSAIPIALNVIHSC